MSKIKFKCTQYIFSKQTTWFQFFSEANLDFCDSFSEINQYIAVDRGAAGIAGH